MDYYKIIKIYEVNLYREGGLGIKKKLFMLVLQFKFSILILLLHGFLHTLHFQVVGIFFSPCAPHLGAFTRSLYTLFIFKHLLIVNDTIIIYRLNNIRE